MTKEALVQLSRKFLQGHASAAEQQELHNWYDRLSEMVDAEEVIVTPHEESAEIVRKRILAGINAGMEHQDTSPHVVVYPSRPRIWMTVAAASILVLLAGAGGYWLLRTTTNPGQASVAHNAALILPGRSQATLLLADNHRLPLNDSTRHRISQSSSIAQSMPGQLFYTQTSATGPFLYNQLSTPRGGRYRVILSDGTRIWLNAASDLRYPVAFTGPERRIELSGEAYFEVAPNAKPFLININHKAIVRANAHRFNISSYLDDSTIQASLLDGGLQFTDGPTHVQIQPGQAVVANAKQVQVYNVADTANVTSWKEDQFNFRHAELTTVLHRLARWYNIDVQYPPTAHQRLVSGTIRMNKPLSDALDSLHQAGINADWDGLKLSVH